MTDNFGGPQTNNYNNGGASPAHNGQNNPGPEQAAGDGAWTLHHPILNGNIFIRHWFTVFLTD
jgi:hypothetical protein